jgi:hypothetical protein
VAGLKRIKIRQGRRFVTRQNAVEVAAGMASLLSASTLWPIDILISFLHRLGFSFDAV